MSNPFRVALLGAGWISQVYLEALRRVPDAQVTAIWSRTRERAEKLARRHEVALASDDVDAAIEAADVVCVNSPNFLHEEHAIRAARAGRHVIVEKPLATSLAAGRAIAAASAEAGVGLGYAEELVFVPKFRRAREVIASGAIGEPRYVTQREAHAGPYSPWFFRRDEAGGGVLMDMACHAVELVRYVLGRPAVRSVGAELLATRPPAETPLEDHAVLTLELEGGALATCEASWVLQGGMQSRLEIWGSEGTLEVDLLHATGMRVHTARGRPELMAAPGWSPLLADWQGENGYPQELAHFLACFRSGEAPEEGGAEGIAVLEILQAAYASAAEGRRIALPFDPPGVEHAVDLWLDVRR